MLNLRSNMCQFKLKSYSFVKRQHFFPKHSVLCQQTLYDDNDIILLIINHHCSGICIPDFIDFLKKKDHSG